jgi:uncharacterized protein (DUF924 family)
MHQRAEALLEHWLGPLDQRDAPANAVRQRWFQKSLEYDAWLLREHGGDLEAAERGQYDDWASEPRGRLALVILLDQITRNVRRDSGAMFDNDDKALALARAGVERGEDKQLRAAERNFLYMPFMHSEVLADQERSVELFTQLAKDAPGLDAVQWAVRHRDVIAKFGRFPHRNNLLDRTSTPDEVLFLQQPGSSF